MLHHASAVTLGDTCLLLLLHASRCTSCRHNHMPVAVSCLHCSRQPNRFFNPRYITRFPRAPTFCWSVRLMAVYTARSITHSLLSAAATTVAARGAEYSRASSPKELQ